MRRKGRINLLIQLGWTRIEGKYNHEHSKNDISYKSVFNLKCVTNPCYKTGMSLICLFHALFGKSKSSFNRNGRIFVCICLIFQWFRLTLNYVYFYRKVHCRKLKAIGASVAINSYHQNQSIPNYLSADLCVEFLRAAAKLAETRKIRRPLLSVESVRLPLRSLPC